MQRLVLIQSLFLLAFASSLSAQSIARISQNVTGGDANGSSANPSISADGWYVAFESVASNFVPGDNNGFHDIYVHDRKTGQIICASVNANGEPGDNHSQSASLSADGNFVVFMSYAGNLVPGDTNGYPDIFVRNLQSGEISRVSISSGGAQGNGTSNWPSISADGRYIAFDSFAGNLVPSDRGYDFDVFVHDQQTSRTSRVSITSSGKEGNYSSFDSVISADGRFVAFGSYADNLVAGDLNTYFDLFIHDRLNGWTKRISVDSSGLEGNAPSANPCLSADGLFLVFESDASNLVLMDRNRKKDVFLYDLIAEETTRVSVDSDGLEGNYASVNPTISADGRIIAFESLSDNLVPFDRNDQADVFIHDPLTGQTKRASVNSDGVEGGSTSLAPSLTQRGRVIVFGSLSNNLTPGDSNQEYDIFASGPPYNPEVNTILLTGPFRSSVHDSIQLNWETAPPNSRYWLWYSQYLGETVVGNFQFDLEFPAIYIKTGRNSSAGKGSFLVPPPPSSASGVTLYFEVVSQLGPGNFFESNPLAVKLY